MRKFLTIIVSALFSVYALAADSRQVGHESLLGTWRGTLNNQTSAIDIYFTFTSTDGTLSATMTIPEQGVKGLPMDSVSFDGFNLYMKLDAIQMSYRGMQVMGSFSGSLTQYGMEFPMALTRGEIPVQRRPQEPQKPYPYREEQVAFRNESAGIALAGTLTLPQGNGPFPAVVLISGSGYQNRDEELMGHKPFLVIADALTRAGIAVLRYDDRGVGESQGHPYGNTTADLSWDAEAALGYLKSRPEISCAGLAGHSEGGAIAFIVAAREPSCDFVISLAGPGVRGDKVLLAQQRAILSGSGIPAPQLEQITAANKMMFDTILSSESNDEALRSMLMQMTGGQEEAVNQLLDTWMYYFLRYDPTEDIASVKAPILALNGTKDMQVIHSQNIEAIEAAAAKGGNTCVETVVFEGLNHLFQHCTTGLPTEYGKIEETIAPEVLEKMIEFIHNTK